MTTAGERSRVRRRPKGAPAEPAVRYMLETAGAAAVQATPEEYLYVADAFDELIITNVWNTRARAQCRTCSWSWKLNLEEFDHATARKMMAHARVVRQNKPN